ncbi:MAG TPA: sigma-70 family RNA polymerase sigma factor [Chitinophagaceae bacterium]|nr:sigma-70 family RNA polymerase sigma factor [Chitinophagaceae bacterium]
MSSGNFPHHINSHEQVKAIRANDQPFLQWLYREQYPKTESFVLQNNGTAEQAKDIYQEAFIAMWRNVQLGRFVPKNEQSLPGYLLQIAKNKWLDYLRSSGYKRTTLLREGLADEWSAEMPQQEEDSRQEEEYIKRVRENFRELGDNCRKVLTAFYFKKESMKKIADAMGWTEATARNNKYRCIERLRALMKNQKQ